MSQMFKLRYEGDARKEVFGIGVFDPGDEKEVTEQVANDFTDTESRHLGWVVIPPSTPKSKTTKPALNTKTKTVK